MQLLSALPFKIETESMGYMSMISDAGKDVVNIKT